MRSAMKTTATKEDGKPPLVPKLRFPEFLDEEAWEPTTLGAKSSILKGKGISKADIDPNGQQPCIRYGELYTRYGEVITKVVSRTNVPPTDLFFSKPDDVIVPSSGETKIDIAKASCVLTADIALGSDLNVIRSKLNGTFLSYYLNGPKRLDIAKVAQGDTVVHLYPHQLEALQIAVPKSAEQQKIAECLSSVDELIAAQARKLDALKTHKKGLMQQLFPREGETQPRLRFPEFRNAGEWEAAPVKSFAEINPRREVRPDDVEVSFVPMNAVSEDGFLAIEHTRSYGSVKKGFTAFRDDDIILAKITPCFENGKAALVTSLKNGIGSGSTEFHIVRTQKTCSPKFIFAQLYTDKFRRLGKASMVGSGGHQRVPTSFLEEYSIHVPTLSEQQRIANCLTTLDNLIAAQTQKLDTLKTHKKGLMQQLFPSAQAVTE
jgi:type I restriction enzyme, S subunit